MAQFLGIDTSNYTTSVAVFDSCKEQIIMCKKLLPVKSGALGLRQSEAVFLHIKQLSLIFAEVFKNKNFNISAIGVSNKPRDVEGSYMPCFLVGETAAEILSAYDGIPAFKFSHQQGHIAAAVYSAKILNSLPEKFYAFHVSGGTTEILDVEYDKDSIFKIDDIGSSLDLKAGQAVDRVGKLLNLPFPSGKYIDELSLKCEEEVKVSVSVKDTNCCLSGLENIVQKLLNSGKSPEYISLYTIEYIKKTIYLMTKNTIDKFGNRPIVFAGGVMSNTIISRELSDKFDSAYFAAPEYSSDNAAGAAILAAMRFGEVNA